jgi:AcrR family transcriptional regulator
MRKLASQLGFEVMSLYTHVSGKGDLLDGMVDAVAAEIALPDESTGWRQDLRAIAIATHAALARHPWAAPLWATRTPGPARLAHMEALLRALGGAGLPPEVADRGFHAVVNHVLGHTMQEQAFTFEGDQDAAAAEFLAGLDPAEFPHLIEHVRAHLAGQAPDVGFEFVLDLILDSLDREVQA